MLRPGVIGSVGRVHGCGGIGNSRNEREGAACCAPTGLVMDGEE